MLATSLPRAECVRRLGEAVDDGYGPPDAHPKDRPVLGAVDEHGFRIRRNIRPMRNSFQEQLYGRMEDAPGGGTLIACQTGVATGVKVLQTIFALATGAWAALVLTSAGLSSGWTVLVSVALLFQAALTAAVFGMGRPRSSPEALFLVNFVMEMLDARPEQSPPAA